MSNFTPTPVAPLSLRGSAGTLLSATKEVAVGNSACSFYFTQSDKNCMSNFTPTPVAPLPLRDSAGTLLSATKDVAVGNSARSFYFDQSERNCMSNFTPTPVAPLTQSKRGASAQAVPAISKWTQGVFAGMNSFKNIAAVMVPP